MIASESGHGLTMPSTTEECVAIRIWELNKFVKIRIWELNKVVKELIEEIY